ncbi:hypothetical protein QFZ72_001448 [Bacillus sp. V2I10]|nr:hypothetical protein [Bacillus sp. V2I10]
MDEKAIKSGIGLNGYVKITLYEKGVIKMGMPLELNTMIVTKGRENRLEENLFSLEKEGYRIYPLEIPVEVRKTKEGEVSGQALIKKLELSDSKTILTYQLIALKSTN